MNYVPALLDWQYWLTPITATVKPPKILNRRSCFQPFMLLKTILCSTFHNVRDSQDRMKNDVHASAYGSDSFQNIRIPHAAQPGIKKRKKIKKSVDKPVSLCYDIKAVRNTGCCETACGLVAQLDRVFDYESKGRGFESRRSHHERNTKCLPGI